MLTSEDIRRLCKLARIEITSAEIADVSAKLSSIVAMVDQLQAAATEGVGNIAALTLLQQHNQNQKYANQNVKYRQQCDHKFISQSTMIGERTIPVNEARIQAGSFIPDDGRERCRFEAGSTNQGTVNISLLHQG